MEKETGKILIEKILKELNIKAPSLASNIGVDYQRIYDIQKGKTKRISAIVANSIFAKYPQFNINWLLTGEGEMLREGKAQSSAIPLSGNCQPILDIRVSAGHGNGLYGDEKQVIEWVNIPKFEGCCGIMVYGDSMYDKFKSGDIIFVRPIQGRSDFDFGQCYVVITNEDRYIKNVYESLQGKDYITMTSFNIEINPDGRRKYPDRDIHIDDIKHLYKVAGKLRRDQL